MYVLENIINVCRGCIDVVNRGSVNQLAMFPTGISCILESVITVLKCVTHRCDTSVLYVWYTGSLLESCKNM